MREIAIEDLDFSEFVRPGDTVAWTSGTGEPCSLSERLVAQRHDVGGFRLLLGTLFSQTLRPDNCDGIAISSIGAVGAARKLAAAGKVDVLPVHQSEFAKLIRTRRLPVDIAVLQVAEDPETGQLSYGAVNGYGPDLLETARVVIAEINERAPFTYSTARLPRDAITLAVRGTRPLLDVPDQAPDAVSTAIAGHVAGLVRDGAVLQIGVGSLPGAVLSALEHHRDLGLHSGTIGDAVIPLIERGVINNSRKNSNRGTSVTGTLLGTARLYRFAHRNRDLLVEPVSRTHDLLALLDCARLTTINSAIEVDLTGQVNAEVAGSRYLGTVGGQVDFMRASRLVKDGVGVIALPSTTAQGASRIVSAIAAGVVTTARSDVDYVVTEHGVAQIGDCGLTERARRLIAIAHPDHRETLERAAHAIAGTLAS